MKIITNNKIYIQKKDLELIFKTTNNEEIPNNIIDKYKENIDMKDLDFIFFEDIKEISFLNSFWFIIDYNDIIDFNELEIIDYYYIDLQNLRKMKVEYDKHQFLPEKKQYTNLIDLLIYTNYIPTEKETKNYPLDFQLLYNKVSDVMELNYFKNGQSKLELPEEIFKPVRYTKKQLQRIYYEILGEELTFEELKPYEKQLYSIFIKINYTPDILNIIRKIIIINRYNTIDFINDDLLNIILHIEGKKTKFEESTINLIDYLYTIGYNKFENFDSKIILEKDLKIIKKIIDKIACANLEDKYIEKLSNYNYILAEITKTLNKCNYLSNNSRFVKDVFLNMICFVYFKPNVINYDYDFLKYAYDYINNNLLEIIKFMGYDIEKADFYNENFIDNFNQANNLLLYLYNQKYKNDVEKVDHELVKSKNNKL